MQMQMEMQTFEKFDPFVLHDENMRNYLKHFLPASSTGYTLSNIQTKQNTSTSTIAHEEFFLPQQADSLFWCFYILKHGQAEYEMLINKSTLVAKQIKIQYVQRLRDQKPLLKALHLDTLINLESNLANDHSLNIKTFMALCALDHFHVVFIRKNTYFELEAPTSMQTNEKNQVCLIKEMPNRYHLQYGICIGSLSLLQNIQLTHYKIDSLDKPIKAVSCYKLEELQTISIKLGLTVDGKTKAELYKSIVHYFV